MTKNKKLIIIFTVVIVLAALVVLNSVIFSVQHVHAVCRNDDDADLDAAIEKVHGIRYGSNIFWLNEEKTVESISKNLAENGIANITVLGIVRSFPNRVHIHYVKTVDYFYVLQDGQAYYFSNKNSILTAIKPESDPKGNTIELKIKGNLTSVTTGTPFASTETGEAERVAILLSAFERTEGLPFSSLRNYFNFVDVSFSDIYIKTERGVFWKFHSTENFLTQFENALSAYMTFRNDPVQMEKTLYGTIIPGETPEQAWYDKNSSYPG